MSAVEQWLTPDEVAERLKLHRGSVYRLISTGVLPAVRIDRALRVPGSSLMNGFAPNPSRPREPRVVAAPRRWRSSAPTCEMATATDPQTTGNNAISAGDISAVGRCTPRSEPSERGRSLKREPSRDDRAKCVVYASPSRMRPTCSSSRTPRSLASGPSGGSSSTRRLVLVRGS